MHTRRGSVITCNWLDLPENFLLSVGELLENSTDIRRFRSVCQKWRDTCKPTGSKAFLSMLLPFEIPSTEISILPHLVLVSSSVTLFRPLCPTTTPASPWIVRAEEVTQGNIHLRNPITGDHISFEKSENLPPNLDLTQFHVSELFTGFNLVASNDDDNMLSSLGLVEKVLAMHVDGPKGESYVILMVLFDWGNLAMFDLKGYCLTWCPNFHDFVIFRGKFCAIDARGVLYQIDSHNCNGVIIGDSALCPFSSEGRKRLVVSRSGDLYLVGRNATKQGGILVFVLKFPVDSSGERGTWVEVKTLDGKVMFLSADQGFLASADDFPGHDFANCIVFSALSMEKGQEVVDGQDIGVFRLGDTNHDPIYLQKDSLAYIWSPPSWLSQPHTSSSKRDTMEDKESFYFSGLDFLSSAEEDNLSRHKSQRLDPENEILQLDALKSVMNNNLAGLESLKSVIETAKIEERVNETASKRVMTSLTKEHQVKSSGVRVPMMNFGGFIVRSDLAPTLEEIWLMHGNIVDSCTMRNGDIVARVLESLATIELLRKNRTEASITKEQVVYMNSTLSVSQHMKINVEWLVPYVEKATDCYATRAVTSTLEVLDKVKDRASETKSMLLAELAKLEKLEQEVRKFGLHLSARLACLPNQLMY